MYTGNLNMDKLLSYAAFDFVLVLAAYSIQISLFEDAMKG